MRKDRPEREVREKREKIRESISDPPYIQN